MAAGEAPIKQAVQWIDDQLADNPSADRVKLVDEAARRFDLSPLDPAFPFRPPAPRERRRGGARGFLEGRGAGNVAYVAGDVEALPFADSSFDVVTCRIAAHHFADPATAVRQVQRVLRPGGSLLLQDILGHDDSEANAFVTEVERRRDPSHVRAYRAAEWKAFLRAAGLSVLDEARVAKTRRWEDWTGRMRMSAEARADLEAFVRAAPERCRAAFDFTLAGGRVESFTDRMLLLRADRD